MRAVREREAMDKMTVNLRGFLVNIQVYCVCIYLYRGAVCLKKRQVDEY